MLNQKYEYFCTECGSGMLEKEEKHRGKNRKSWYCSNCGDSNSSTNSSNQYCMMCGKKKRGKISPMCKDCC